MWSKFLQINLKSILNLIVVQKANYGDIALVESKRIGDFIS